MEAMEVKMVAATVMHIKMIIIMHIKMLIVQNAFLQKSIFLGSNLTYLSICRSGQSGIVAFFAWQKKS